MRARSAATPRSRSLVVAIVGAGSLATLGAAGCTGASGAAGSQGGVAARSGASAGSQGGVPARSGPSVGGQGGVAESSGPSGDLAGTSGGGPAGGGPSVPAQSEAEPPAVDELPPDALPPAAFATSPEHTAPSFGGDNFGLHLVEPPADLRSPPTVPFSQPLRIPRILPPSFRGELADFYEIHARPARQQILPGAPTTVWGYEGELPGPTIVARRGRPVVVRQWNDLPEVEVVHLHGMRTPPESDGHPTQLIPPGGFRDYFYPNPPDKPAATLWYHDHAMDLTGPHIYKGLAAFYLLVDPPLDARLHLPTGAFDVPLVIQDRIFSTKNQLLYPPFLHNGVYGDKILVNGVVQPFFQVERRKYRFRVLNGSNARTYQLALSDGSPLDYIGNGAGLVPRLLAVPTVQLPAADRVEVLLDFARYPLGARVTLLNLAGRLPGTREVMRFDVTSEASSDTPDVTDLVPLSVFDGPRLSDARIERTFVFERRHGLWVVNGKIFEPNRIDATPRLNEPEIWTFVNKSGGWVHPIHHHLAEGQILDRNGIPATSTDTGYRDVELLHKGETVRVLLELKDYSGKYAMHCHNAEHEDMRMMGSFFALGTSTLPSFLPGVFPFPLFPPPLGPSLPVSLPARGAFPVLSAPGGTTGAAPSSGPSRH